MATKIKTPLEFDQAKLQRMQEPLTVRVEKKRGNSPTAIELPPKDGAAPGTNWTRDEVLRLENWVLNEWSGGGYYLFSVTDANGETMKWESIYDPRVYPEKVPPNQANAAQPNPYMMAPGVPVNPPPQQQQAQQPQQAQQTIYTPAPQPLPPQGVPLGMTHSNWPPPGATFGYNSQVAVPQPQPQPQQQWVGPQPQQQWMAPQQPVYNPMTGQWGPPASYGMPPFGTPYGAPSFGMPYGLPGPSSDGGSRRFEREYAQQREHEREERQRIQEREREERQRIQEREQERLRYQEELRRKDDEIRMREMAQKDAEYKASLERQQQQHTIELAQMRDEIRRSAEKGRDQENDEVRRAREDRERMERERERLERERERDQINQQFQLMQQAIAKVAEKPADDPRLRTLELDLQKQREDARIQQEHLQRERERWEAQRSQEQLTRESQRAQEQLAQQMREQENRTQLLVKEATANRADPMVEFMKENARLSQEQARMQAETAREIARMQQMGSDRMASMMMTPQALAGIIRDSSSGTDMLMKNVVSTFSGIFGTMRNAMEQTMQLTGGNPEPPAARIIEQGIARAGEMAERYIGMKTAQAQGEARVAAAKAQGDAQVRTAAMQAQAAAAAAAAQQAQARRAAEYTTASGHTGPVRNRNGQSAQADAPVGAGLSGAQQQPQPQPAPRPQPAKPGKPAAPKPLIEVDDGVTDPKTGQTVGVAKVIPLKRAGRTDEEWFGVALESVTRLRLGVKTFMGNLAKVKAGEEEDVLDDDGNVIGLDPNGAIDAILKGVNYVSANNIEIPAFEDLFKQGRFAEFMDVVIPEAPDQYRVDCVKILTDEVEVQIQPPGDVIDMAGASEEEDEDGDEQQLEH